MSGSESVPSGSRLKRSGGVCLSPTYTGDWLISKSRHLAILSNSIKPWPMTPPKKAKIPRFVRFQGDLVEEVLRIPAKSSFKRLILETPLWTYSMSSSLKSPPEGFRMREREVGCATSYPVCPPDQPNQETRRQANQGEDARRHQLWYGCIHKRY